jgi:hypothetical protein
MKSVAHFSVRSQQAIGAALIERFCFNHQIFSDAVSAFITHQWDLATVVDIPAWDKAGAELKVNGRGDPLPGILIEELGSERAFGLEAISKPTCTRKRDASDSAHGFDRGSMGCS